MARHIAQHPALRRLVAAFFLLGLMVSCATALEAASPSAPGPDVLTLSEAAELLRIGPVELEALASKAEVPARRIGSSWRFNRDALMAWLNGDWRHIATIEPPDAARPPSLGAVEPTPAIPGVSLTQNELQ